MFLQSSFRTEFLSESNLLFTQSDFGNNLEEVYAPIKSMFQDSSDLLSYSLARYCGASTRLAFVVEWIFLTHQITLQTERLRTINLEFFKNRVPLIYKGIPSLHANIAQIIDTTTIPLQLGFLHKTTAELIDDAMLTHPHIRKYVEDTNINRIRAQQWISQSQLFHENMTITSYIETLEARSSYIQIALPCLIGFVELFHQEDNPINPKAVKWVIIEEIFASIAMLHQSANSLEFLKMLHFIDLSDKERFEWFSLSDKDRELKIIQNMELKKKAQNYRLKYYQRIMNHLERLVFPDKYTQMIRELSEWAFGMDVTLEKFGL